METRTCVYVIEYSSVRLYTECFIVARREVSNLYLLEELIAIRRIKIF